MDLNHGVLKEGAEVGSPPGTIFLERKGDDILKLYSDITVTMQISKNISSPEKFIKKLLARTKFLVKYEAQTLENF